MEYDVIVIGAGPAGSTTARYASKGGLKVLLIDKKKEIGIPVQCGEFLPSIEELRKMFPKVENLEELFLLSKEIISKKIKALHLFSPSGRKFQVMFDGFSIERSIFDRHLVNLAVLEGTEFLENTTVTKVEKNEVHTDKGSFKANIIVGADGPLSNTAQWLGMPKVSEFAEGITCEVPGEFEPSMEMYFGSVAPGGYAWIVPKENSANIGLRIQRRICKEDTKKLLDRFLIKVGCSDRKLLNLSGKLIPASGPVQLTVKNSVLLVGDAAGHSLPSNGFGVPTAMICARVAGSIIADHLNFTVPLEKYESEWKRLIGRELRISLRTKRFADPFVRFDLMLNFIIWLLGERGLGKVMRCKPVFGFG